MCFSCEPSLSKQIRCVEVYHRSRVAKKTKTMTTTRLPELYHSAPDLKTAQLTAQRKGRYLLVYLHSDEHPRCAKFLNDMEADTQLQRTLTDQFFLWGVSVDTPEGYVQMTNFGATAFPFIAMGVRTQFVASLQGGFTLSSLKAHLQKGMEVGAGELAKEIAFHAERNERESLRREQDRALEEAMKHDQARAAAKAAEQSARIAAAKAAEDEERRRAEDAARAEEEARLAALRAEQARAEIELKRAVALSSVPPEPDASVPACDVAQLRIMATDGTAITRKFLGTTTVGTVFTFVESLPQHDGSSYELVCGFPPKPLDRNALADTPIRDVKALWPRSVVSVRLL